MKKTVLLVVIAVVVLMLMPIFGNKVVQNELNKRLGVLKSYGVEISQNSKGSNYFTSRVHYEFLVKDEKKFMDYIQQFSDQQLPPYTNAMVEGVLVGADVLYSNFAFSDKISIDIYPLSFSKTFMHDLKEEDSSFYEYIKTLLKDRTLLYHINYNIVSNKFDGYIKNIKEHYTFKNDLQISTKISGATFSGEGPLIAPSLLKSDIKHMNFSAITNKEKFGLIVDDFKTTSNFQSHNTYATTMNFKKFKWFIDGTKRNDVSIEASNIYVNASSNAQSKKMEFYVKTSFKDMHIKAPLSSFEAVGYNSVIALSEVNKESFEKLRILLSDSKVKHSKTLQNKIAKESVELLSKGLKFEVADLSLNNFSIKDKKNIRGFKIKAKMILKEDRMLKGADNIPIDKILQDIDMDAKFIFSKRLMAVINTELPFGNMVKNFAKTKGNDIVFDVKFKNSKLIVNDKHLN